MFRPMERDYGRKGKELQMNLEERITQYAMNGDFSGCQWECVFDGKRRWENVAYMRCTLTGILLFIPPYLFQDDS